jgi:hypothetical protein
MDATQRDMRNAVFSRLCEIQQHTGAVSNAEVNAAALILRVHPRTIRRNLTNRPGKRLHIPYELTSDDIAAAAMCDGNVAAAFKFLTDPQNHLTPPPVSLRTFQRAFAERFDATELAGMRGRYKDQWHSLQAALPALRRYFPHRAHTYSMDHTLLPNWVRLPGSNELIRPWCSDIVDECTGLGMRASIYPREPTMEQSVELLAAAVEGYTTKDGIFIGGMPKYLLSDRGPDLITRAMTLGRVAEGGGRKFTPPRTPRANGRVERGQGTLKHSYCVAMPGFDMSGWTDPGNPRAPQICITADDCLLIGEFAALLVHHLDEFNTRPQRPDGKSRLQRWAEDPTPLLRAHPAALRASLTQRLARVCKRGVIQWDNHTYTATELFDKDWRVEIAVLSTRHEYIDVYHNGQWICRAYNTEYANAWFAVQAEANRKRVEQNFAFYAEEAQRLRRAVKVQQQELTAAVDVDPAPNNDSAPENTQRGADDRLERLTEGTRERIDRLLAADTLDDRDDELDGEA